MSTTTQSDRAPASGPGDHEQQKQKDRDLKAAAEALSDPRSPLDSEALKRLRLNPARVERHAERLRRAIAQNTSPEIPVLNSCTVNNDGILSWKSTLRFTETDWTGLGKSFLQSAQKFWNTRHLVTCIPAAGAASRYLADLRRFADQIESIIPDCPTIANSVLTGETNSQQALPEKSRRAALRALTDAIVPRSLDRLATSTEAFGHAFQARAQQLSAALTRHLSGERVYTDDRKGTLQSHVDPTDADGSRVADRKESNSRAAKDSDPTRRGPLLKWGIDSPALMRNQWRIWQAPGAESRPFRSGPTARIRQRFPADDRQGSFLTSQHWMERVLDTEKDRDHHDTLTRHQMDVITIYAICRALLDEHEGMPKAMAPTTDEGDSFLFLKLVEQMSLLPCRANVLICPAGMENVFEEEIRTEGLKLRAEVRNIFETARTPFSPPWLSEGDAPNDKKGEWMVMEQGEDLSTIRFTMDGEPLSLPNGQYSPVSAGHGELVHLFPEIVKRLPQAECLHIRNIDNIIGTGPERRREIQTPAKLFRVVRDCLEAVRRAVQSMLKATEHHPDEVYDPAAKGALQTLMQLHREDHSMRPSAALGRKGPSADSYLNINEVVAVIGNLFHWPRIDSNLDIHQRTREVDRLLSRPLSVFGVVRKEVTDIGGGPVFARMPGGETVKICMEMPHASKDDREMYFGARGKASHFNPVLVFFELRTHTWADGGRMVDCESLFDDRFWLMATKEFAGEKVYYHETVLYELIGNSATANLLFAEVPRTLFNPHKTVFDSLGQDRRSYGFEETLLTLDD
jgi:hypothetical protein